MSMQSHALVVFILAAVAGYVQADCYPGDTIYTNIVQEIYHGVTADNIRLTSRNGGSPISRYALCSTLVQHHNHGRNLPYQWQTNRSFLSNVYISVSHCTNALTYTQGYNSISGWQQWEGYHSGYWYSTTMKFSDGAQWSNPSYKQGLTYVLQPVRFDSQERLTHCTAVDQTGATCRNGWNQSGLGVLYVWGWDPKENGCFSQGPGRQGAHVGFPFSVSGASCIVWVTTEEAFLECVRNNRRTSTTSRTGSSSGYGQWTIYT